MEPIMARVNDAISAMREEGGYALILDAAQGTIVAADPALDLTAQILERLRQGPAAAGPPNR
jgi:Skp family chaperone for outer membrane proteins